MCSSLEGNILSFPITLTSASTLFGMDMCNATKIKLLCILLFVPRNDGFQADNAQNAFDGEGGKGKKRGGPFCNTDHRSAPV